MPRSGACHAHLFLIYSSDHPARDDQESSAHTTSALIPPIPYWERKGVLSTVLDGIWGILAEHSLASRGDAGVELSKYGGGEFGGPRLPWLVYSVGGLDL